MKEENLILGAVFVFLFCCVSQAEKHPCDRDCDWQQAPKVCKYKFTVEWYYTMSKACYNCPYNGSDCLLPHCVPADGVARPFITVNKDFPGPAIRVCHNDTVFVDVYNRMDNDEGVTLHWHGLYMDDTPYMDGVPMLTQCPIPAKSSFKYQFRANPPGTHWWHAHTGLQRSDGLAGPLIIKRAKKEEPHKDLYDTDIASHVMFVFDWLHQLTLTKFIAHHHSSGSNKGENILINGKGVFKNFSTSSDNITYSTPREVFAVEQNKRHRFRTISNAALFCPYEISIDGHLLNVIASDGADIEPFLVSSLVVHGGERFDFVVNASQEVSNYWVRIQGMADCRNQSQKAILRYRGAADTNPETSKLVLDKPLQLNPWNIKKGENHAQVSSLKPVYSAAYPQNDRYKGTPSQTHFIGFDFNKKNNPIFNDPVLYPIEAIPRSQHLYSPQLNNISFKFPEYPILTQPEYINDAELCDPESSGWDELKFCPDDFCYCPYFIDIEIGNLVELVIYDEGRTFDAGHPMHIHGQHFAVVAMDKIGRTISTEEIQELHSNGSIRYDYEAVFKDTVIVPDGGYTVVRFLADNPGVWFFHCHLAFHSQIGMELAFRVGKPKDWITAPKNFPKCGTWPSNYVEDNSDRHPFPQLGIMLGSFLFTLFAID